MRVFAKYLVQFVKMVVQIVKNTRSLLELYEKCFLSPTKKLYNKFKHFEKSYIALKKVMSMAPKFFLSA